MKYIFAFVITILLTTSAWAKEITGKVVGVTDGDTVKILTESKNEVTVRLSDIDAPEKDQPYGMTSKQALSGLVFGKQVAVTWKKKDRYGRTVGTIYIGPTNVNATMISSGHAWVYLKYSKDKDLIKLEGIARKERRGIWAIQSDQIMAPWDWRSRHRKKE